VHVPPPPPTPPPAFWKVLLGLGGTLLVGRYVLVAGRAISVGGAAALSTPVAWAALGTAGLSIFAHSRGAPLGRVVAVAVTPFALGVAWTVYEDGEQAAMRAVRQRGVRVVEGALGTQLLKRPRERPLRDPAAAAAEGGEGGGAAAPSAAGAALPTLLDADVAAPAGATQLLRQYEVEWQEGGAVRRGVLRVEASRGGLPLGRWDVQRLALSQGAPQADCEQHSVVFDMDRAQIALRDASSS